MEDFIYIILGIVWLVISILGGKKKKQAQQSQPSQPQPYEQPRQPKQEQSEIEDMLEEFFGTGNKTQKSEPAPETMYEKEQQSYQQVETPAESLETLEDNEYKRYETKYSVGKDYEFSAEGKIETLEDLINQYKMSDQQIQEEEERLSVVDLDLEEAVRNSIDFDARKAIIYSEIINRKYA